MAGTLKLNVVQVDKRHQKTSLRLLLEAVRSSSFIALDLELSGLGDKRGLNTSFVEDRYSVLCETARTHSILSLGASCFSLNSELEDDPSLPQSWTTKTFNVLLLSQVPYVVDPDALQFLVRHEFDFNKQYSLGVPYTPSSHQKDKEQYSATSDSLSLRDLLAVIHRHHIPVVVHNGLVDLVFLYNSFYTHLPSTLAVFLADLNELFTGGIYDTKVIAEYERRERASFLEYLFTKCHRANVMSVDHQAMSVLSCIPEGASDVEEVIWRRPETSHGPIDEKSICETYAYHGYCRSPDSCPLSHDIHLILAQEEQRRLLKVKKRRKRHKQNSTDKDEPLAKKTSSVAGGISLTELFREDIDSVKMKLTSLPPQPPNVENKDLVPCEHVVPSTEGPEGPEGPETAYKDSTSAQNSKESCSYRTHRAGVDAFMTGYCFGYYASVLESGSGPGNTPTLTTPSWMRGVVKSRNKIALAQKSIPLQVCCSNFVKPSQSHSKMIHQIAKISD